MAIYENDGPKLSKLLREAERDATQALDEERFDSDTIHEIAEEAVPLVTELLLGYALDTPTLMQQEVDADLEETTAFLVLRAAILERIWEHLDVVVSAYRDHIKQSTHE